MKRVALKLYVGQMDAFGVAAPDAFLPHVLELLTPNLEKMTARKPSEQQRQHFGFAGVLQEDNAPQYVLDAGVLTLCMQKEAKVIPADTVRQRIEERTRQALAALNADLIEGEEPATELTWEDVRQIKESVMLDMMKTDQTVRTRLLFQLAVMNDSLFFVAMQSTSSGMIEPALNLMRTALGTLPVIPVSTLISNCMFNSWVAGFAMDRTDVVSESLSVRLGSTIEISDGNKVSTKIKELGKTQTDWLKLTLTSMQVTSAEIIGDGWEGVINRGGDIKQLLVNQTDDVEYSEEPDQLTLFRADQLLLGNWARDYANTLIPELFQQPTVYDMDTIGDETATAQVADGDIAGVSKEALKLQQWQIDNGYRDKPADAMEQNPFEDEDYETAKTFVVTNNKASISALQRHMKIGYNRAARIIEELERKGVVSAPSHNGAREVLA